MTEVHDAADVLTFWLAHNDDVWFKVDRAFDATVSRRFGEAVERAKSGAFDHWADSPEGALALVILLDQMSRNIYRDTARMYAADDKALAVARRAIERGFDQVLAPDSRRWLYMPFMHAENLADQERGVELFARSDLSRSLEAAVEHADIIRRFGRFPHRNAILGRVTTAEEQAFLEEGGFAGTGSHAPADRET